MHCHLLTCIDTEFKMTRIYTHWIMPMKSMRRIEVEGESRILVLLVSIPFLWLCELVIIPETLNKAASGNGVGKRRGRRPSTARKDGIETAVVEVEEREKIVYVCV